MEMALRGVLARWDHSAIRASLLPVLVDWKIGLCVFVRPVTSEGAFLEDLLAECLDVFSARVVEGSQSVPIRQPSDL